jgi:transcriptional regulator with XRE-family HTH domain
MNSGTICPGRKLRVARVIADLSQDELGTQVGYHQTYISMLERGKWATSMDVIEKLARACGCKVADLLPDEQAAA